MAGVRRGLRPWGVALALLVVPGGASAAEPEPTVILPGVTLGFAAADLVSDEALDLVRLVQQEDGETPSIALEAWSHDGVGWSVMASAPLEARSVNEPGLPSAEIATLMQWRVAGEQRVLLATALGDATNLSAACCMQIGEVTVRRGEIVIEPAFTGTALAPQIMQAIDVDADGTDELLVQHVSYSGELLDEGSLHLEVLRWNAGRFESIVQLDRAQAWLNAMAGDSDGLPGDEVVIGPSQSGDLERLTFTDGEVVVDDAHLDLGERGGGWIPGMTGGTMVVVLEDGARAIRWPRGAEPVTVGRLVGGPYPYLLILGAGPDALVVGQIDPATPGGPATTVYDLTLRPLRELGADPDVAAVWDLVRTRSQGGYGDSQHNIHPYFGPLPGGMGGSPAHLASGMLIQAGGADRFEIRPMTSIVGYQPLGMLGPRDGWVALGDGVPVGAALLQPVLGLVYGTGRLVLAPMETMLTPGPPPVTFEPDRAVEIARSGDEVTLLAPPDGFTATVTAPEGTLVVVADGALLEVHEVGSVPIHFEVTPPRNREGNAPFDRDILVISPEGRAALHRWQGTFVREAPQLVASAKTDLFSLEATVTGGSTSPGARVTVDGAPVALGDDGSFRVRVEAPPWPRDVAVVVRDALGNEAVSRLQVIGFLDYRGLPWVPILGLATLLAGVTLFVRSPGRRPVSAAAGWGDGTLEEIDGD